MNAEPVARQLAHGAKDVGFGADVDAAAGLIHQKHFGIGEQGLADNHLLLVAA